MVDNAIRFNLLILAATQKISLNWMRHGATDSAKDYGARGPRFDSQQWIAPRMAFYLENHIPLFSTFFL
jgi:hypothetical protein